MKSKILLVDDDASILRSFELILKNQYQVKTALSIDSAIQLLALENYEVVVTDLNFHGQPKDGISLIDWINSKDLKTPVIILSGEMDVKRVMDAQKRIVDDFLLKPVEAQDLILAIEKARQRGRASKRPQTGKSVHEVLTQDERILFSLEQVKKVIESNTTLPICIYGESGTGKEEIAKYAASVRGGPFVAVNMAAINGDLQESELFGHVKGAFTGANSDKTGKFQAANGGVLFLDEIGDCPLDLQIKLLRVLQEKEITRVGSNTTEKVDVKIVTATNQNLKLLVKEGKFREELLYRIEGQVINLPPLRERVNDIPLIVAKFIQEISPKARPADITPDALEALKKYAWPGNVRELRRVVEKALLQCNMRMIDVQHLPGEVLGVPHQIEENRFSDPENLNLDFILEQAERVAFKRALEKANGSRRKAIEFLGITESKFFRRAKELNVLSSERGFV